MSPQTFADYATLPHLDEDEIYTVELLIERVRRKFDDTYWDEWMARADARSKPAYQPWFSLEHIAEAADHLQDLQWLSFSEDPIG